MSFAGLRAREPGYIWHWPLALVTVSPVLSGNGDTSDDPAPVPKEARRWIGRRKCLVCNPSGFVGVSLTAADHPGSVCPWWPGLCFARTRPRQSTVICVAGRSARRRALVIGGKRPVVARSDKPAMRCGRRRADFGRGFRFGSMRCRSGQALRCPSTEQARQHLRVV